MRNASERMWCMRARLSTLGRARGNGGDLDFFLELQLTNLRTTDLLPYVREIRYCGHIFASRRTQGGNLWPVIRLGLRLRAIERGSLRMQTNAGPRQGIERVSSVARIQSHQTLKQDTRLKCQPCITAPKNLAKFKRKIAFSAW